MLFFLSFGKLFRKLSCSKDLFYLLQTFSARMQNIDMYHLYLARYFVSVCLFVCECVFVCLYV